MGKPTGFKEFQRETIPYRLPLVRIDDYQEIYTTPSDEHLATQGGSFVWIAAFRFVSPRPAVQSTI